MDKFNPTFLSKLKLSILMLFPDYYKGFDLSTIEEVVKDDLRAISTASGETWYAILTHVIKELKEVGVLVEKDNFYYIRLHHFFPRRVDDLKKSIVEELSKKTGQYTNWQGVQSLVFSTNLNWLNDLGLSMTMSSDIQITQLVLDQLIKENKVDTNSNHTNLYCLKQTTSVQDKETNMNNQPSNLFVTKLPVTIAVDLNGVDPLDYNVKSRLMNMNLLIMEMFSKEREGAVFSAGRIKHILEGMSFSPVPHDQGSDHDATFNEMLSTQLVALCNAGLLNQVGEDSYTTSVLERFPSDPVKPAEPAALPVLGAKEELTDLQRAFEIIALDFVEVEILKIPLGQGVESFNNLQSIRGLIKDHVLEFRFAKPKDDEFDVPKNVCKVQLSQLLFPMDARLLAEIVRLFVVKGH